MTRTVKQEMQAMMAQTDLYLKSLPENESRTIGNMVEYMRGVIKAHGVPGTKAMRLACTVALTQVAGLDEKQAAKQIALMKVEIAKRPADQQQLIAELFEQIDEVVASNGDAGKMALALISAEVMLESGEV